MAPTATQLPPRVKAAISGAAGGPSAEERATRQQRMDDIGKSLAAKRKHAIDYRVNKGIEAVWMRSEDAYNGVDDANRGEARGPRIEKPTDPSGPVWTSTGRTSSDEVRSTLYVRLTSRYVDAGKAKITEILLPIDDRPFSIQPTPIPELVKFKDSEEPVTLNDGTVATRAKTVSVTPGAPAPVPTGGAPTPTQASMGAPPSAPAQPAQPGTAITPSAERDPLLVKDLIEEHLELAQERAEKMARRMEDQLIEASYRKELGKVLFDAAKLGTGVLKGPFPERQRAMAVVKIVSHADGTMRAASDGRPIQGTKLHDTLALEIVDKIIPKFARVNLWNVYPDPACGEHLENGDYLWERDLFSPKQVRDLKGLPGYLDDQIEKVLKEGPGKKLSEATTSSSQGADLDETKDRFEIWFYAGTLSREDMGQLNPGSVQDRPEHEALVFAQLTMINDTVVGATLQPLESGRLIYHAFPWQRRDGYWAGVGIAEQVDAPQRMIVGATRAWLNNAGLSAGGMIIVDSSVIEPVDGKWRLTPRKLWKKKGEGILDDVRKAFTYVDIPSKADDLFKLIEYAFRVAEETTNIPLITQGMSGSTTPDTYGATQLQNNNANQLLRDIGWNFDDYVTVPKIHLLYEWNLLDPDVPEDEKGDFQINAHGSSALVERSIQAQEIDQMGKLVLEGGKALGWDPRRWGRQWLKARRLNPKDYSFSPEELDKMDSQPPTPPAPVQVAQIKAQTEQADQALTKYIAELENQTAQLKVKMDTDRDTVYAQAETALSRAKAERMVKELELKRELAVMDYANRMQITLEDAKTQLADTAMKLRVQKELSALDLGTTLHQHHHPPPVLTPPDEPAGRAQPGKAFEQ